MLLWSAEVARTQGFDSHFDQSPVSRKKKPSPAALMYSQAMLARQNDPSRQQPPRSTSIPNEPPMYMTTEQSRNNGRMQNVAGAQNGLRSTSDGLSYSS